MEGHLQSDPCNKIGGNVPDEGRSELLEGGYASAKIAYYLNFITSTSRRGFHSLPVEP
ncbi:MAG: hypothetical protein ABIQ31_17590 [Ferruginibacter sp.]